jgi:hypothetical protein
MIGANSGGADGVRRDQLCAVVVAAMAERLVGAAWSWIPGSLDGALARFDRAPE